MAETGNISAAAKNLYISQSAVSQSVKQLETALQARLFARSPRGVTLTGEGQMLYQYVRNALGLLATGEDKLSQAQQLLRLGELVLAGSQQPQRVADVLIEHLSLSRQGHAAGGAGKQTSLQSRFQLLDRLAHSRLGDIQVFCCRRDIPGFRHLFKNCLLYTSGMVRDVLLGNTPPAAFQNPTDSAVAVVTALILFLSGVRHLLMGNQQRYDPVSYTHLVDISRRPERAMFSVRGMGVAERVSTST